MLRLFFHVVLILIAIATVVGVLGLLRTPYPTAVTYGVSFNVPYARELGLDWHTVYTALLDDLHVREFRLAAHWPLVEPEEGRWHFDELDEEMRLAKDRGAHVILAVGRRLPRWPECHVPVWASHKTEEEQKQLLRTYLREVVLRYKDNPALTMWQVENEPFLTVYAREQCGELDRAFLDEELTLVRTLDPTHPLLVTDSGNLGLWYAAYRRGDVFGTSVYVHLYNEATGPIRTILPPQTYVVKRTLMELLFGRKPSLLIELSLEPWLGEPLSEHNLKEQEERMSPERFDEVLSYARDTRFDRQYLWGAEWWYWLREHGTPAFWDRARGVFASSSPRSAP